MKIAIKGSTIYLRFVNPSDYSIIFEWENNQENWLISGTIEPFTKQMIVDFVNAEQSLVLNKQLRLIICESSTNVALGAIDLFDYDEINRRAGVGILVAKKSDRNKGIGKESLALLIEYVKNEVNLHQLYCSMFEDNEASKKLFISMGFEYIGCRKDWFKHELNWKNELLFQLIIN